MALHKWTNFLYRFITLIIKTRGSFQLSIAIAINFKPIYHSSEKCPKCNKTVSLKANSISESLISAYVLWSCLRPLIHCKTWSLNFMTTTVIKTWDKLPSFSYIFPSPSLPGSHRTLSNMSDTKKPCSGAPLDMQSFKAQVSLLSLKFKSIIL